MSKITNFKIRIGERFNYIEPINYNEVEVIVTDIIFDGFIFLIEFRCVMSGDYIVTAYPKRLRLIKPKKKDLKQTINTGVQQPNVDNTTTPPKRK